jgi:hypothetical protein
MPDFDAELYLRLAGERMILDTSRDQQRSGWSSPIADVASALAAIEALTVDQAQTIARDYELALALRGDQRWMGGMFRNQTTAAAESRPLTPARAATCQTTFETAWGSVTVHYVVLSTDKTTVALTATVSTAPSGSWGLPMPQAGGHQLRDDQGTVTQANFNGGGSSSTYRGHLAGGALSPSTRWIEIDGNRIDLHDVDTRHEVIVEALPDSSPAERYLWSRLDGALQPGHGHVEIGGIEAIIDAMIAAGAITADDSSLRQVRAVANAVATNNHASPDLPAKWASVLSRRSPLFGQIDDDEVPSQCVVGAATPSIDGAYLRVNILSVIGGRVSADVDISPGSAARNGGGWGRTIGGAEISWWAEDDRGNHYVGSFSGGSSAEIAEGNVNFEPPLAETATSLRLLPTGATQRAVITVPIPPPFTKDGEAS